MWGSAFHFLPLWARPCLAVSTELHYFVSLYSSAFCVTHQSPFTAGSLTPIFFFFFFFFLVVVSADVGYLKEAALLYPSLPLCLGVCRLIKHNKGIATLHDIAGVRPYPTHLGIFVTAAAPPPHHPSPAGCGRMLNLHLCSGRPYFFIPLHVLQSQSVLGVWGTPVSCPSLDHRHTSSTFASA